MTRRRGNAPSQRQLRVGEEIRHAIAALIERGAMKDPELRDVPVTVTEVRTSPDLRHAEVFVTPFGGGDAGKIVAALNRAAPYFRAQVASVVRLKFAPQVHFAPDTSFEQAGRIESILRRPHVRQDIEGAGPDLQTPDNGESAQKAAEDDNPGDDNPEDDNPEDDNDGG